MDISNKVVDYIQIDNGDMFAGSWEQLRDCFGIGPADIDAFCKFHEAVYTIQQHKPVHALVDGLYCLARELETPAELMHRKFKGTPAESIRKLLAEYENSTK